MISPWSRLPPFFSIYITNIERPSTFFLLFLYIFHNPWRIVTGSWYLILGLHWKRILVLSFHQSTDYIFLDLWGIDLIGSWAKAFLEAFSSDAAKVSSFLLIFFIWKHLRQLLQISPSCVIFRTRVISCSGNLLIKSITSSKYFIRAMRLCLQKSILRISVRTGSGIISNVVEV
jgi:hypothetical protein